MKKFLTLSLAISLLGCNPQAIQQTADSSKTSPSPSASVSVSPSPQASASVLKRKVITEAQVKNDKMIPTDDETIVIDLENKDATAEPDDTGTIGKDIIPVSYTKDISATLKWDGDKNGNYLELKDKDGNVIYKVEQGGTEVTKDIPKGDYTLEFTSNETTVKDGVPEEPVFMRVQDNLSVSGNLWHLMWALTNNCSGCCLSSGYYPSANFEGRDFSKTDLWHAQLSYAKLTGANLSGAYLEGATLSYAKIREANLTKINLSEANLYYADLTGSNLSGADLHNASFKDATLKNANISYANISGAKFTYANLTGADLTGVNITGTDFSNAIWIDGKTICPEHAIGGCR